MTFEQLKAIWPDAKWEEWTQHDNGGGWVKSSARCSPLCYIEGVVSGNAWVYGNAQVSGNAQVYGDAQVYGNAQVSGDAQVYGNAQVSGNAKVSGDAKVYGNAWVYGNAQVSGNAKVSGNAQVYGNAQVSGNAKVSGDAQVSGDAWVFSPLYIQGTKHAITVSAYGKISVGCQQHVVGEWKKNGRRIAIENGYTKEQMREYAIYIDMADKWMKMHKVHKVTVSVKE